MNGVARIHAVIALLLAIGCAPPSKPSNKKPTPAANTLEQIAYESFQRRDILRAEKLFQLADDIEAGKIKYDGPVMDAWAKIGAQASEESWKPAAAKAASQLDGGSYDAKKIAEATRQVARGSRLAGGGK